MHRPQSEYFHLEFILLTGHARWGDWSRPWDGNTACQQRLLKNHPVFKGALMRWQTQLGLKEFAGDEWESHSKEHTQHCEHSKGQGTHRPAWQWKAKPVTYKETPKELLYIPLISWKRGRAGSNKQAGNRHCICIYLSSKSQGISYNLESLAAH